LNMDLVDHWHNSLNW